MTSIAVKPSPEGVPGTVTDTLGVDLYTRGRVGGIGSCVGGRYTLLMAVSSDRLDAAVEREV